MAAVRHLGFSKFSLFVKNSNLCLFLHPCAKLVKIGRSAAELLHNFDFQNGGRLPSWIWYDVISDHTQLAFDGPNILLRLHIDRIYTLQDITFYIRPVWVEIAYACPFWGVFGEYYPQMNSDIVTIPKRTVLGRKHVV